MERRIQPGHILGRDGDEPFLNVVRRPNSSEIGVVPLEVDFMLELGQGFGLAFWVLCWPLLRGFHAWRDLYPVRFD